MNSGRSLVGAAFVAALAACVTVPAAGAGSVTARNLLVTKAPIRAFAQDSSRFAWVDGKWRVETHKLGEQVEDPPRRNRPYLPRREQQRHAAARAGGIAHRLDAERR